MNETTSNPIYLRATRLRIYLNSAIIITIALFLFIGCNKEEEKKVTEKDNPTASNPGKDGENTTPPPAPNPNNGTTPNPGGNNGNTTPLPPSNPGSTIIPHSEIILVEGGTFDMGSPKGTGKSNEHPQHKVTLTGFKITKYEITNQQFAKFLTHEGNQTDKYGKWFQGKDIEWNGKTFLPRKGLEKRPVVRVTWSGAKAFSKWVGGRLPSEAEWEYAAKGGKKSKGYRFSGSNDLSEVGWYLNNSGERMHDVGEKKPNELGIYDMSGNVWEYTGDYSYRKYTNEPQTDPQQTSGQDYLRRGASAFCPESACRVANRSTNKETTRHNMGFRVVFPAK